MLSLFQKVIIWAAVIPTSLWFPIFFLQLFEQTRMVQDIRRLNVKAIMTRGLEFAKKDLLLIKELDQKR